MENYLEHFVVSEKDAQSELNRLSANYAETGMYPCAGGFVVWADRSSDRGE
jgi:hypothetical protein